MTALETFEDRIINSIYPGRGIIIGCSPDGENIVQIYWIMGRSENSRNRVFEKDGSYIRTKAYDPAKVVDPSLIIYYPMKEINGTHIVTNGDQTETVFQYIKKGKTFKEALMTRQFEPDPPNYTPRISGISYNNEEYELSILKAENNDPAKDKKEFFVFDKYVSGIGHCLTTYIDDGNPLPPFEGKPYSVKLFNDIDKTANTYWDYLNKDNRVSLAVKFINVKTHSIKISIINKNS